VEVEMLKFHFDECVKHHPSLAAALKRQGVDVTVPESFGLRTAGDEKHRQFAIDEGRVIITCDSDFLEMHNDGIQHAGITYFKQLSRAEGDILAHIMLMHDCMLDNEMKFKVEYIPRLNPPEPQQ